MGEPLDRRPGTPPCPGSPGPRRRASSVSARCRSAQTLACSSSARAQRGGRGERRRHVLEAGGRARRPARRPGNGLRQRADLRTSRTPTPAGPPHLCAEAAAAAPARRGAAGDPPRHTRRRTGERRPRGDLGHGLAHADLRVGVTGGRAPPAPSSASRGRSDVGVDTPVRGRRRGSRTGRRGRRATAPAWSTAECSTRGGEQQVAVPGASRQQAEHAEVAGVRPARGEGDLVRRGRRGSRPPRHARCRASAGRRAPGRCRRRGSAYPRSRAWSSTSRAAGCSGVPGGVIEVRRNRGVRNVARRARSSIAHRAKPTGDLRGERGSLSSRVSLNVWA